MLSKWVAQLCLALAVLLTPLRCDALRPFYDDEVLRLQPIALIKRDFMLGEGGRVAYGGLRGLRGKRDFMSFGTKGLRGKRSLL